MTEGRDFFYSNAIPQSEYLGKQKQPFSSTDPFGVHIYCAYLQVQTQFHLFQPLISRMYFTIYTTASGELGVHFTKRSQTQV